MFGCSNDVTDMVATGFMLYAVTFLVMGYDVINSMYFTSCGDAKSSALISGLRGIVLLLAFIFILPAILGMNGVWLAAPCTEGLTARSVCRHREMFSALGMFSGVSLLDAEQICMDEEEQKSLINYKYLQSHFLLLYLYVP